MSDLALCALKRAGKPLTSAELADHMNGLADAEGMDRVHALNTPKHVAAMLTRLEEANYVRRTGVTTERGNMRPLWSPSDGFDSAAPLDQGVRVRVPRRHRAPGQQYDDPPARQQPTGAAPHPLVGRSPEQVRVLFDVDQDVIETQARQLRETAELVARQGEEMTRLIERSRARLTAAGLA